MELLEVKSENTFISNSTVHNFDLIPKTMKKIKVISKHLFKQKLWNTQELYIERSSV
ncbi:unnamed protein product [Paramecium octaurelia]|uniref:Uncharacterized protein n=1 Tax=Paramecium octaurelia TaxID=43137 RepID=A0A8S1XPF5_PAROT|nr:unnamed protein product [Paramecium octaurelia]